jgi:hypothetical protein
MTEERENEIYEAFVAQRLRLGRMVGASKTAYYQEHPDNDIYFNANIFTKKDGKIWWGDLDVTLDEPALQEVAKLLNQDLYVLREHDARCDNENLEHQEVEKLAKHIIKS